MKQNCYVRCNFPTFSYDEEGKVCLKNPGKDPKASSAHSPGRSVPGLMRQTLQYVPQNMLVNKKRQISSLRQIGPQRGFLIVWHIKRSVLYLIYCSLRVVSCSKITALTHEVRSPSAAAWRSRPIPCRMSKNGNTLTICMDFGQTNKQTCLRAS